MKFNPSIYKLLFMARAADVICGEAAEWKAVQMNYHILILHVSRFPLPEVSISPLMTFQIACLGVSP